MDVLREQVLKKQRKMVSAEQWWCCMLPEKLVSMWKSMAVLHDHRKVLLLFARNSPKDLIQNSQHIAYFAMRDK